MFISDIEKYKRNLIKTAFVYLLITMFIAFFGLVYEHYSHEVYSNFMIYAFAFPLVAGVLPSLVMVLFTPKVFPNKISTNLYHSGVATLTVGSVLQGVVEIYGTTNILINVYWYVGAILLILGVLLYLLKRIII